MNTNTSTEEKFVNRDQLIKILMGITGSTFATITAETEAKMNKTNNPYYGEVTKVTEATVNINFNYQNAVNNARAKEDKEADFVAQPRKWGQHVPGTPLILHNGAYYLEARFLKNTSTTYYHKNVECDKSLFESFMPTVKESKTQDLENQVIMRDFKIENIKSVVVNKVKYIVQ